MGWNVKSHSISFFDNNFEKQIEIIKRTNYFLNLCYGLLVMNTTLSQREMYFI